MDNSKDRRNFLKLILTGGALAVTGPVAASQQSGEPSSEKISLLREDGTLMEIDRAVYEKMKTGKKAANHEIRDFVKHSKK
jgi:pheromone shutdown protein TraB